MEKISNISQLDIAIQALEQKARSQEKEMESQFHEVMLQFTPTNIFKNSIRGFQSLAPSSNQLLKIALGIGAGFIGKRFISDKSTGVLGKAAGTLMELFIARYITKHKSTKKAPQPENPAETP